MVARGAPVAPASTLMLGVSWLATQTVPSGARASVRGFLPTGTSKRLLSRTPSMAVTVSASGFTTQARLVAPSYMMVLEAVGAVAVGGEKTVSRREQVERSVSLLTVTTTGECPGVA